MKQLALIQTIKRHRQTRYTLDNFRWQTLEGELHHPREFKDEHLANIVVHLVWRHQLEIGHSDDLDLAAFLYEECKLRGFTDEFILANHPWEAKSGEWMIWDFDKGCPVPVRNKAKIVSGP